MGSTANVGLAGGWLTGVVEAVVLGSGFVSGTGLDNGFGYPSARLAGRLL